MHVGGSPNRLNYNNHADSNTNNIDGGDYDDNNS